MRTPDSRAHRVGALEKASLLLSAMIRPDFARRPHVTFLAKNFISDRWRIRPRLARFLAGVVVVLALWGFRALIFGNRITPTWGYTSAWPITFVTIVLFVSLSCLIFFVADATWLCWHSHGTFARRPCFGRIKRFRISASASGFDGRPSPTASTSCLLRGAQMHHRLVVWTISRFCFDRYFHQPVLVLQPRPQHPGPPDHGGGGSHRHRLRGGVAAVGRGNPRGGPPCRERLIHAKGNRTSGDARNQLELMMRRIEELREGAFSPFSQQPVVRATPRRWADLAAPHR